MVTIHNYFSNLAAIKMTKIMILNFLHPAPYFHSHPHHGNPLVEGIIFGMMVVVVAIVLLIIVYRHKKPT